jgi:pyrimidine-nucleoside phosphorylase
MANWIEFIEKKRDGREHSEAEIKELVEAVANDSVPDYQLAAWLMAVYFEGLTDRETVFLARELGNSGAVIDYPKDLKIVDKHSAGGVGDKTTLIIVPLVAACGAYVSKLSGPGLGYTGGTVDKLESIPGMSLHMSEEDFKKQIYDIGCAVSGHSKELAPAEGKFYKLRDVTGTVPSIPLITSSILSKKLAGGARAYVFDVKCGDGAFMADLESARELAEKLVATSRKLGKKSMAIVSGMDEPLGNYAGNSLEVLEAVEVLSGAGASDTRELCIELAAHMLLLSGAFESLDEAVSISTDALDKGRALEKFREMIMAQGGDGRVCAEPLKYLPMPKEIYELKADRDGKVSKLAARLIGEGLRALGGGRLKQGAPIDHSVGVKLCKKIGKKVKVGETVLKIGYNKKEQLKAALPYFEKSVGISDDAEERKLILDRIF